MSGVTRRRGHQHEVLFRIAGVALFLGVLVIPYVGLRRKLLAAGTPPGWGLELTVAGHVGLNALIFVAVVWGVSALVGWLVVGRTLARKPPVDPPA